jgi:hypothetical protein
MHHCDRASATTGISRSRGACPKSGSHHGREQKRRILFALNPSEVAFSGHVVQQERVARFQVDGFAVRYGYANVTVKHDSQLLAGRRVKILVSPGRCCEKEARCRRHFRRHPERLQRRYWVSSAGSPYISISSIYLNPVRGMFPDREIRMRLRLEALS